MEDDSKYFFVWVTAVAGSSEAMIVAGLVKAGYDVDPISKEIAMYYQGSPSCVIGLRLLTLETEVTKVFYDVEEILQRSKVQYHSLIISESTACMYIGSNIKSDVILPKKASIALN